MEYVQGDFLNVVGFPLNHFCKQLGKIYNNPPESPTHKMICKGSAEHDGHPTHIISQLKEMTQLKVSCFNHSDSASCRSNQEQNEVEPKGAKCNSDVLPHKILDLLDGFKASKVHSLVMVFILII